MAWIQDLHKLEEFMVCRCFKTTNFGTVTSAQLHYFADTCEEDYGAVSYLLLHKHTVDYVMGKARLAP